MVIFIMWVCVYTCMATSKPITQRFISKTFYLAPNQLHFIEDQAEVKSLSASALIRTILQAEMKRVSDDEATQTIKESQLEEADDVAVEKILSKGSEEV